MSLRLSIFFFNTQFDCSQRNRDSRHISELRRTSEAVGLAHIITIHEPVGLRPHQFGLGLPPGYLHLTALKSPLLSSRSVYASLAGLPLSRPLPNPTPPRRAAPPRLDSPARPDTIPTREEGSLSRLQRRALLRWEGDEWSEINSFETDRIWLASR